MREGEKREESGYGGNWVGVYLCQLIFPGIGHLTVDLFLGAS